MESFNLTSCRDDDFGPVVSGEDCRGGFDFTLTFQESILSLLPATVFLVCAVPRALYLLRRDDRTKKRATYAPKLISSCALAVSQIVLLALTASTKLLNTRLSIAVATINVCVACSIIPIIHAEHVKTIRPSFLLTAYLILSALFDATRLRTEWLMSVNIDFAVVLSVSLVCKVAVLALETMEKHRVLLGTKTPSSESTSGPLNRGLFIWLNSLFFRGWKGTLKMEDIPRINEKLESASVSARFQAAGEEVRQSKRRHRLLFATIAAVKWDLLFILPPRLVLVGLRISQPFLISRALAYLTSPDEETSKSSGYGLIGAFSLVFIGSALIQAWYEHLAQRTGAIVRGGLITLIYPKMLKLPTTNLNQSSAVALMGNDVETLVARLTDLLIEWWACALTVGIAIWMLAMQLGAVCVVPVIAATISLFLSSWVGKAMISRLKVYQQACQDRINFTAQVVSSVKAVKMLGYAESFARMVREKRRHDLDSGRRFRWLAVASNAISNVITTQTDTITFGAFAIVAKLSGGESFTAAQAAVVLSILAIMMSPLRDLLHSVTTSLSAFAAFDRIQDFLSLEERIDGRIVVSDSDARSVFPGANKDVPHGQDRVRIRDATFSWGETEVLRDLSIDIMDYTNGSLTIVIGPVGSGKSNFLKSLLGETSCTKGVVSIASSDICFCDQTPWLINATIRDNIVGESGVFDETWFDTVVEACDLNTDLASLTKGSDTIVGDNGVKLSGGQKQRMAIARAVYSRKKIAIFDDVFSGLDKVTEQTVFTRVFGPAGLLRRNGTTVILATHTVNRLPQSDFVIALDCGRITQQGRFDELRLSTGYVSELDVAYGSSESDEEPKDEDKTSQNHPEKKSTGTVAEDEAVKISTDRSIFMYYFRAVRLSNIALLIAVAGSTEATDIFRRVLLTWWGDARDRPSTDLGYWLGLYGGLGVLQDFLIVSMIAVFLIVLGPVSGYTLHNRVLNAVMNAPMSFLSNTETGNIINRFSQDMRLIDFDLPIALGVFITSLCNCFGTAGLAVAAVNWFGLAIPAVIIVMILVQRFYIRTSKQLRLLEIEQKAPLYSHFLESITGLATIRAFGWTSQYEAKNIRLLDYAQKPSYLMGCIQRWLALVMELTVACLTVLLITLAILTKGKFPSSLLGIALVTMMGLGGSLQTLLINWSGLETSLGAVSRVKDFTETTPSEASAAGEVVVGQDLPRLGELEMKNVSLIYGGNDTPAFQNVSLNIKAGERVGLCGRSGSGKSSMIQAILRMADITSGQLLIDGQDLTTVPRNEVRKRLSCLTQEPFLLNNTVRFNMDPTNEHGDESIINALDRVGLWDLIVSKSETTNRLDELMDEGFLSHGQRQLFCLGRALLKKSHFLILDEPTSNVDKQTDAQMQHIIREEFKGRTIIMIAHRLHTLMDFDKIVVLDQGSVVEVGTPKELLAQGGAFAKLFNADSH